MALHWIFTEERILFVLLMLTPLLGLPFLYGRKPARLILVGLDVGDGQIHAFGTVGLRGRRLAEKRAQARSEPFFTLHFISHFLRARASSSSASSRYAFAPREPISYAVTGFLWLGASESRTLRGMTVLKTLSLK